MIAYLRNIVHIDQLKRFTGLFRERAIYRNNIVQPVTHVQCILNNVRQLWNRAHNTTVILVRFFPIQSDICAGSIEGMREGGRKHSYLSFCFHNQFFSSKHAHISICEYEYQGCSPYFIKRKIFLLTWPKDTQIIILNPKDKKNMNFNLIL